jgi:hypothetical protein
MKTHRVETFNPASRLWTTRPDPWKWTSDIATIVAMAMIAFGVRLSGAYGSGMVSSGVLSAAIGMKRPI